MVKNYLTGNAELTARHDSMHDVGGSYDEWLKNMQNREGAVLVPIPFSPNIYPGQQFEASKVDALDPYVFLSDESYYLAFKETYAQILGGMAVWDALCEQMLSTPATPDDDTPLLTKTAELMANGKNIMVVTSHITFEELGYLKALRFYLRQDRARMDQIGTVLNKLMARQSLGGKPVVSHFADCGNVYLSCPDTTSSQKHGVYEDVMAAVNGKMLRALVYDLKRHPGHEVDVALTGKQIIPVTAANGKVDYYEIPAIDPTSAKLVRLFDYVYGATLIKSPTTGGWDMAIGSLINVKDHLNTGSLESLIDQIYVQICQDVEKFTGTPTVYTKLGNYALNGPTQLTY
jgi:hypothetical protein